MATCPTHPGEELTKLKKGWFCEQCEAYVEVAGVALAPAPTFDLEALPTVLALPLSEMVHESSPVLALWAACDAAEIALKLCVMAGVAQHASLPDALLRELKDRVELPTLGKWLGMAQAVAKYEAKDAALSVSALVKSLEVLLGGRDATVETGLLPLRNRLAHGGPVTKAEAARLHAAWVPRVRAWAEASLGPLSDATLAAVDGQGRRVVLRGTEGREVEAPVPADAPAGSAWLCVAGKALPLGPLAAFESGMQLYVRRGEVRLQYLRMGEDGGIRDSSPDAMEAFRKLFHSGSEQAPEGQKRLVIRDFAAEVRKESSRRVGREREFTALVTAVRALEDGVVWVSGPAGIGKSNLVAAVMEALLDAPPADTLVLPYRFRAGDDRCGRVPFLTFLRERLEGTDWLEAEPEQKEGKATAPDAVTEVKQLLSRLRAGARVLLLLDGLDEVLERDARFVEDVLFRLREPRVAMAAAGRPERGLQELFAKANAIQPFPRGLPPMGEDDVRALLLERTGPVRKRLLGRDREAGGAVQNAFIERVTRESEGLPLYVNYVAGDLNAGKVSPENPEGLPRGLHAYHEELLRRASVGDLQSVTTPVLVLLALSHEPLTIQEMVALLKRRQAPADDVIVERAVQAIASMVRRAPDPDGEEGYTVFHHSLRTHVQQSPEVRLNVEVTRAALAEAALRPAGDAAEVYLYRCGVRHLLEAERTGAALGAVMDFTGVMARLRRLAATGREMKEYFQDWGRVQGALGKLSGDARTWEVYLRERKHLLRRGSAEWPAYKIFLQLAVEHADDSPVTRAAEAWLVAGNCDWLWLRRMGGRPVRVSTSASVRVLEGHRNEVKGAIELSGGRILSWSDDHTLRIWNLATGETLAVLKGHTEAVTGALVLPDGRILSWSKDHTLRTWDGTTGAPLSCFEGHSDIVHAPNVLPDGRILSWSKDRTLRIWDADKSKTIASMVGHGGEISRVLLLSDGRILSRDSRGEVRSWDGVTGAPLGNPFGNGNVADGLSLLPSGDVLVTRESELFVWSPVTGSRVAVMSGHSDFVWGTKELSEGRILSWSFDDSIRLWDWRTGDESWRATGHKGVVFGGIELPSGHVLTWDDEGALKAWDAATGRNLVDFVGHTKRVRGARVVSGERLVTWAMDSTIRLWDIKSGTLLETFDEHTAKVEGVILLADGGLLSWSADQTLRVWGGESVGQRKFDSGHSDQVNGTGVLSDVKIFSWSDDGVLRVWDRNSGRQISSVSTRSRTAIVNAKVSLGGRLLFHVAGNSWHVWDGKLGTSAIAMGHPCPVWRFERLPDGRLVTLAEDNVLRVWDGDSGARICAFGGHRDSVQGVVPMSHGRILSYSDDLTLRVWDSASGEELAVLEGHAGPVTLAKVLDDGRVLSCSRDKTLRIWDVESGMQVGCYQVGKEGAWDAVRLNDGRILSTSTDEVLRIWQGEGGPPQVELKGGWGACVLADGNVLSWSQWRVWLWEGARELWCTELRTLTRRRMFCFRSLVREFSPRALLEDGVAHALFHGEVAVGFEAGAQIPLWQADGSWTVDHLLADGIVVARCQRHLAFLRLFHGTKPVSVREAREVARATCTSPLAPIELEPGWTDYANDLVSRYAKLGDAAKKEGKLDEARRFYEKLVKVRRQLCESEPTRADYARWLSNCLDSLGNLSREAENWDEARPPYEESLQIRLRLHAADPARQEYWRDLGVSHLRLGDVDWNAGRREHGLAHYEEMRVFMRRVYEAAPERVNALGDYMLSHERLVDALVELGRLDEGQRQLEELVTLQHRLCELEAGDIRHQVELALVHWRVGDLAERRGDTESADAAFEAELKLRWALVSHPASEPKWKEQLGARSNSVAWGHYERGNAARLRGDIAEASRHVQVALPVAREAVALDPDPVVRDTLAALLELKARVDAGSDNPQSLEEAIALRRGICDDRPDDADRRRDLVTLLEFCSSVMPGRGPQLLAEAESLRAKAAEQPKVI